MCAGFNECLDCHGERIVPGQPVAMNDACGVCEGNNESVPEKPVSARAVKVDVVLGLCRCESRWSGSQQPV